MRVIQATRHTRQGAVLLLAMIFLMVVSALAVALAASSGTNVQMAFNQHKVSAAFHAAQSGLECARYFAHTAPLGETYTNQISIAQANQAWVGLCTHIQTLRPGGAAVSPPSRFTDALGSGDQIVTPALAYGNPYTKFTFRFYRYDANPRLVKAQSFGAYGDILRRITMDMDLTRDREVLRYAVASRGRVWLTGDTTIRGNLFSTWNRASISPYNMTVDTAVQGTIHTVLALDDIRQQRYRLETLDVNNCPLDVNGMPLGTNYGDRYYGPQDEVKAFHEGIQYGQPFNNMPGMDISDFNTDMYTEGLTTIPASPTGQRVTEYFPHVAGNYEQRRDSGSASFVRHIYENQTFTNALLPVNRHALFRNCTFQEVLYIDTSKTSASKQYANNVRFENCTFNGIIVTDAPQPFNWMNNCLYFTGTATFDNQSAFADATILAPHFNVNLGNTNPRPSESNVLTGAIVGGIVDVRGNAQVYGTIISMADTTMYTSGYVTNIGATLADGGSETTEVGDVGVIRVTPAADTLLPSGISSPIVLAPNPTTYSEGF